MGFRDVLLAGLAASLLGCGGSSHATLPAVLIQAEARLVCPPEAGCEGLQSNLQEPHCGHSVSSLSPEAETVTVDVALPPSRVEGLLSVETAASGADGGREALPDRRSILIGTRAVGPAFGRGEPLYRVDAKGTLFLADAGASVQRDGGGVLFRYSVSLEDGGSQDVEEAHTLLGVSQREVEIRDHRGDPFYGCCGHLGWAAPSALGLALAALSLLRARRG